MPFDVGGIVLSSPAGATLSMDDPSTGKSWMKVDANGILTRPQTPFMRGQLVGRGQPYAAVPLLVTADVNLGGCWNNATGYFTCPTAGRYMIQGACICGGSSYGYFYIRKNSTNTIFTHWNHTSNWTFVSLSGIIPCAVGDTLSYSISGQSPAGSGAYGVGGHCMFSIALMA